jgi:hypothetical protein
MGVKYIVDPVLHQASGLKPAKSSRREWAGFKYTSNRIESETRFWDEFKRLESERAGHRDEKKVFPEEAKFQRYSKIGSGLRKLYRARRKAQTKEQIERINAAIRRILEPIAPPTGRPR